MSALTPLASLGLIHGHSTHDNRLFGDSNKIHLHRSQQRLPSASSPVQHQFFRIFETSSGCNLQRSSRSFRSKCMQHTGRSMRIVSLVIAMFVCETMFCSRIFVLLMFQPFAQHRLCSLRSFCAVPTRRDP